MMHDYPLLAAIDLGTNACRLLVSRVVPRADDSLSLEVVDAFSRSIRLGGTLGVTGKLAPQAMDRALGMLSQCADRLDEFGDQPILLRCVATAACRKALNCREFMQRIHERTGLEFEVISIHEETRLAVLGSYDLLDYSKPYAVVFDIGGGSSEVIWVDTRTHNNPQVIDCISLPYGVVTIGDALQRQDNWSKYLESIQHFVTQKVFQFGARHAIAEKMENGQVQMLGTSGTVTTFAAIHKQLAHYDREQVHGMDLNHQELDTLFDYIYHLTHEERIHHPCIGPGRADLVMAGAAIFRGVYEAIPARQVRVADRGVRDGVLFDLLNGLDTL